MKKLITLAALAAAITPTFAEMVSVSNVLATTKFEAINRKKEKTSVFVRLTDASRLCGTSELEAIVTFGSGWTESGCWRVVGDAVYLTGVLYLGDTVIPVSQFEGSPLPTGKVVGAATPISRESAVRAEATLVAFAPLYGPTLRTPRSPRGRAIPRRSSTST